MPGSTASECSSPSTLTEKQAKKSRSAAAHLKYRKELESRVREFCRKSRCSNDQVTDRVRELTLEKLKRHNESMSPMHYLLISCGLSSSATSLKIGSTTWNRPDPRVLYHIIRSNSSLSSAEYGDGTTQLAIFFIEDVLLTYSSDEGVVLEEGFLRYTEGPNAAQIVKFMQSFAKRGFRIVLIDHIPSLHYGSAEHIRGCLNSLFESIAGLIGSTGMTVTILLSVTTNLTFSRRLSCGEGFAFPRPGLWQFFTQHLNGGLTPDARTSFVVGCNKRRHCFLNDVHKKFASAISVSYKEISLVLEEWKVEQEHDVGSGV